MRTLFLILTFIFAGHALAENIYIDSENSASGRSVILEEHDDAAYLYLTDDEGESLERDALAYMRIEPPKVVDWQARMAQGNPPILSRDLASSSAVKSDTEESDFTFKWSSDGESAALLYHGDPIAFVSVNQEFGYSKAVIKASLISYPWDQKLYEKYFSN